MVYTEIRFFWDEEKNLNNIKKHGLSFDIARFVFSDPDYILKYDIDNSNFEERFKVIGKLNSNVILVIFTESKANMIRLISARRATNKEKRMYEKFRK